MVYRSALALCSPGPFGPDLVGTYAVEARRQYGAKAGLGMGVVGRDPIGGAEGYLSADVLEGDVGAVKAAGVDRMHLYARESALTQADASRWLSFAASAALASVPPAGDGVREVREQFRVLDLAQPYRRRSFCGPAGPFRDVDPPPVHWRAFRSS